MSHKNPNYTEVMGLAKINLPGLKQHFCKSYLNFAKNTFIKKYNRSANLDDYQELWDIYESEWSDYYIFKPIRVKEDRVKSRLIWQFGCKFKIDVYGSICRFYEYKYSKFIYQANGYNLNKVLNEYGYFNKSCADILKELKIEFMGSYIIDNNLLEEYKEFVLKYKNNLPRYFKPQYIDYSHLAYNNSSDDF